ncbi:MAG: hypothetical protein O7G83_22355 [Proteobacteria bacterium]|nr:hypothetical protein [Pseudomonadota bacterium]
MRAVRFLQRAVRLPAWILGAGMVALALATCTAMSPAPVPAADGRFTFVAVGDMPYARPEDTVRFKRLIAEINRVKPAFTVHVGDILAQPIHCTDEALENVFGLFKLFDGPVIYTPGDNEWTDCHQELSGRFDPIERLAKVREIFFRGPYSLGKSRLLLVRQSRDSKFREFVENARWERDGVAFATLHVVGSNNNFRADKAAEREYQRRNTANLAWLREIFELAKRRKSDAVVLFIQANPFFQLFGRFPNGVLRRTPWSPGRDRKSEGFDVFLTALEAEVIAFRRPVLMVHGDTHTYRVDKPFKTRADKIPIRNFTRVEVFGGFDIHGVRVVVHTGNPVRFKVEPLIVKANQ